MPITFFNTQNDVRVKQSFDSPTVYLDHWAVRLLSDNKQLQDTFVTELLSKGGTLLLSNFNFAEFGFPSDPKHCRDTEAFLDRMLPNIFLSDFRLDAILRREQHETNNLKRFWPTADLPQLRLLAEGKHSPLQRLTMHGFVSMAYSNRDVLNPVFEETITMIKQQLELTRKDPAYIKKVRNFQPSDASPRTTLIMAELMRDLNLNQSAPFERNDVIDFIHAVMPLNSCDFVLLDAAWAARVETMKRRIAKAAVVMPLAKCYSQKNNGVNAFLADFAAFDRSADLNPPVQ